MKLLKIFGKVLYVLVIIVLFVIATLVAFTAFDLPGSAKFFTVKSGSMEPEIKVGSVVVTKPRDIYVEGDIITFFDPRNSTKTVTHRVTEVKAVGEWEEYTTKGDANDANDSEEINKDKIIGKVIFDIPYLGYPTSFAKTEIGFILIVVIPATLLIGSEISSIKRGIENKIKKKAESEK